ncbi:CUB domain-containing protein [Peribacillus simplex]|uniref:CUB domain-containing protein n=1 Tax=Peribacillus simplex TaxID=1478 RepID=UPI003CF063B3
MKGNWLNKIICFTLIFSLVIVFLPPNANAAGLLKSHQVDSPHNYTNNYSNTWNIKVEGAKKIRVHFTRIATERYYDYVTTSAGDSWSGALNNVWSEWEYGDTIDVSLKSDDSINDWGFQIDKIEYYTESESEWKVLKNYNLKHEWYGNNENKTWIIEEPEAKAIRVHFKEIDIDGSDSVNIGDRASNVWGDNIHGSRSGVWSSWMPGEAAIIAFLSDDSITGRGFEIDRIEYIPKDSDFPHSEDQFGTVYPQEANPDFGDANRRLADRLIHHPDQGKITFSENKYNVQLPEDRWFWQDEKMKDVPDRSFKLEFSFSPERLYNLARDGNETLEIQTEFYNLVPPSTGKDEYGRKKKSFEPWMTTINPGDWFDSDNPEGPGSRYDDEWDSWIPTVDQADRGSYFYFTNLPSSHYPDTLWPDLEATHLSFSIGMTDAQQLRPNHNYFFEIIGAENKQTKEGIFGISSQRGYSFDHYSLPESPEYYVFNEEWESANETGKNEVLLKYPGGAGEEDTWRLQDIINMKDSRYDYLYARDGYSYSWNKNGEIMVNSGSGFRSSVIDRQWDQWNDDWFRLNSVLGPLENS